MSHTLRWLPWIALLGAGCSSGASTCTGAAPSTLLAEGFCTANEADRCYFNPKPRDGF